MSVQYVALQNAAAVAVVKKLVIPTTAQQLLTAATVVETIVLTATSARPLLSATTLSRMQLAMLEAWHTNIRGLSNTRNFDELKLNVLSQKPVYVFVSETFLNSEIPDATVSIPGYSTIRKDRSSFAGGLLIYYDILRANITRLPTYDNHEYETLWIKLAHNNNDFITCFAYRPPNTDMSLLQHIEESMDSYRMTFNAAFLCIGDFNCHNSRWDPHDRDDQHAAQLNSFCDRMSLTQLVRSPTRYPDGAIGHPSLLDIVLCSAPQTLQQVAVMAPVGRSDHAVLALTFSECTTATLIDPPRSSYYDFYAINDWATISTAIANLPLPRIYATSCPQEAFDMFLNGILQVIRNNVPLKHPMNRKYHLPYVTNAFSDWKELKSMHWNRYKVTRSDYDLHQFRRARDNLAAEIRRIREDSYRTEVRNLVNCPSSRKYWSLARRLYKFSSAPDPIPELIDGERICRSSTDKADLLNQTYAPETVQVLSSYTTLEHDNAPFLDEVGFDNASVNQVLVDLDITKSYGPDSIPNLLLKKCADVLSQPLCHIFRTSFATGILPWQWKTAIVIPVFKRKGSRNKPSSYRPISLISCIAKVMETIVNRKILNHLNAAQLIHESQFGFLKGHSAIDQVAGIHQNWTTSRENGLTTVVAFLDLSNAFGLVPHCLLRHKLPCFGIRGKLFAWISNYLTGRSQTTRVEGKTSSSLPLRAGVPQGSVLAPTLFLMFINDLLTTVDARKSLLSTPATPVMITPSSYADDTLISVSHPKPSCAVAYLNYILGVASEWADRNGMVFNPSKSVAMIISRLPKHRLPRFVTFRGTNIPFAAIHCHLGITLSDDLKFTHHILSICSRVNKELFVLRRLSYHLPNEHTLLLKLYKAYILPHMEYGSIVFAGIGTILAETIERLQRKAVRIVLRIAQRDPLPNEALVGLSLSTLGFRRNYALACFCFKLCNNLLPRALLVYCPIPRRYDYAIRRPMYDLAPTWSPRGLHSYLFTRSSFVLCKTLMNLLPFNIMYNFRSLNGFKTYLNSLRDNEAFLRFPAR